MPYFNNNVLRANYAMVQLFANVAEQGTDKWSTLELRSLLTTLKPFCTFQLDETGLTTLQTPRGPRVSAWMRREVALERVLWLHLYSEGSSDIKVQVTIQQTDTCPRNLEFVFDSFPAHYVQNEQMPAITAATALHTLGAQVAKRLKVQPGLMPGIAARDALATILGTDHATTYASPRNKVIKALIANLQGRGLSATGRKPAEPATAFGGCWGNTGSAGL